MPSDEPTIRAACAGDGQVLADLDRAAWSPVSDVAPRRAEDDHDFFGGRSPADGYLVAELAGRVVGYVRHAAPTPLAGNRHVRQIQGLAVAAEARGRGVGRALVEAACAAAHGTGARRVTLRVLGGNTAARRLYERCGFRTEGVLPEEFLIDGAYVDDVLMGRWVSAG
ncbi:GNAT family N-acetyltransferase [Kitasatospora paranensis]